MCLNSFVAYSQLNSETAFYWENPYYLSPAHVNLDYKGYFSLAARKQWSGLKGAPMTIFATGAVFYEDSRMQVGAKLLHDKIGYISTLDFSPSYTYSVQLSMNHFLNLGIGGAYQSQSIDRAEVTTVEENDPIYSSDRFKGLNKGNFNLGAEYVYGRTLVVGVASQNLLSFARKEDAVWGGVNYVYARYRTQSLARGFDANYYRTRSFSHSMDLEYGVCLKQYEDDFQVDGMVTLYLNRDTQSEKFQVSLFGRSVGEAGAMFGFRMESGMKLLCSYDANFGKAPKRAAGTFEVMLSFSLKRTRNCVYF